MAQDVPPADHLIRVLPRCFTEVMLRVANPFRGLTPAAYKNGVKGAHAVQATVAHACMRKEADASHAYCNRVQCNNHLKYIELVFLLLLLRQQRHLFISQNLSPTAAF